MNSWKRPLMATFAVIIPMAIFFVAMHYYIAATSPTVGNADARDEALGTFCGIIFGVIVTAIWIVAYKKRSAFDLFHMKKGILLILAGIAALAAFGVAQGFVDAMLKSGGSISSERRLIEISKRTNAGLPHQVDRDTRLDTTMAGPGNRLTYVYTLVNLSSADVDSAELTARLKPQIINGYKTLPEMASFRERQVELHYHYRDKNGNVIATIVVSPKDF